MPRSASGWWSWGPMSSPMPKPIHILYLFLPCRKCPCHHQQERNDKIPCPLILLPHLVKMMKLGETTVLTKQPSHSQYAVGPQCILITHWRVVFISFPLLFGGCKLDSSHSNIYLGSFSLIFLERGRPSPFSLPLPILGHYLAIPCLNFLWLLYQSTPYLGGLKQ